MELKGFTLGTSKRELMRDYPTASCAPTDGIGDEQCLILDPVNIESLAKIGPAPAVRYIFLFASDRLISIGIHVNRNHAQALVQALKAKYGTTPTVDRDRGTATWKQRDTALTFSIGKEGLNSAVMFWDTAYAAQYETQQKALAIKNL